MGPYGAADEAAVLGVLTTGLYGQSGAALGCAAIAVIEVAGLALARFARGGCTDTLRMRDRRVFVICEGVSTGCGVVFGDWQRDLEVAPFLGSLQKPRESLSAENLETELGGIALADVVHDVDVEVGSLRASLTWATSSQRVQPRWLPPTALTSTMRGGLLMSAAKAASYRRSWGARPASRSSFITNAIAASSMALLPDSGARL